MVVGTGYGLIGEDPADDIKSGELVGAPDVGRSTSPAHLYHPPAPPGEKGKVPLPLLRSRFFSAFFSIRKKQFCRNTRFFRR